MWTNEQISEWRNQVWKALQPEAFRSWLRYFPDNQVIAYAYNAHACPLAKYLQDRLPHLDCTIGYNHVKCCLPKLLPGLINFFSGMHDLYYLGDCTVGYPGGRKMPTWAPQFMDAIDDRFMRATAEYRLWEKGALKSGLHTHPWPVTAQGAIAVLDSVLPYYKKRQTALIAA
ncbi:MAG: hypothetical protein QNJ46_08000 [Leptolyngbyaceae cyanobacterium MO_188.B28]|nr:hypothetical protein [Leptolyngbyaceae cyanobacterium MO_188.B28]